MNRILLLASLLFSSMVSAQLMTPNEYAVKTMASEFLLKGKIESVLIQSEDVEGKSTNIPMLSNEYYSQILLQFNSNNQLTKVTNYLNYQKKIGVYSEIDYSYNAQKLLSEQKTTVYNNNEDPTLVTSEKTFLYTPQKQLQELKSVVRSKTSTANYSSQFVYANSLLQKVISFTEKSKSAENNYKYNKRNQLISDEVTNFDGKIGKRKYYIYDGQHAVYQEELIGRDQRIIVMDQDQKIKTYQRYNAQKKKEVEVKFNDNEDIIEVTKNNFRGTNSFSTYIMNYAYDQQHNWVACDVLEGQRLIYRITRTITYR